MTSPDTEIRRLGQDDLELFRQLRLEALRLEPASFANTVEDWEALAEAEWRRRLEAPVFAAFRGGAPVGMMGLLRQGGRKMAHRASLIMVYLRGDQRGSGLAGAMLAHVVDAARRDGIAQLELHVSAENPAAIRFYLRQGFAEVGRIPGAVREGGRESDDLLMVRRLVRGAPGARPG
ncbi:MAG: GNAT family N-acetyltransferase [Paracoccaceae bacterium]